MKKRVLSAFMALALCLTLLPTAAWAEEADPPDGQVVEASGSDDTEKQDAAAEADEPEDTAPAMQKAPAPTAAQSAENVAEVTSGGTTTQYADLSDALAAAKDGDTIKLLANAAVGNVLLKDKTVTLDLNGKTVKNSGGGSQVIRIGSSNSSALLIITGRGSFTSGFQTLVVENGTLDLSQWTGDDSYICNVTISGANSRFISPTGAGKIHTLTFTGSDTGQAADTASLNGGRYYEIVYKRGKTIKLGDLLAEGYAFYEQAAGSEEYDRCVKLTDAITSLENVQVKPHTHNITGNDNVCTECGKEFAASVTQNGAVTYYEDFNAALSAAKAGDTLKLLRDVPGDVTVTIDKAITFDLNGHKIYALTVKCKIILKDSAGGTGKIAEWLRVENGLTIGDLLEEGYALRKAETSAWYGATEQTVGNVTVQQAPITSVTLTALNADGTAASTSIPYGTTGGIKLSASCDAKPGAGELSCQWYTIGGTLQLIDGATEPVYQLPADLSVGEYTYRVTFTADGYSKSADITITITATNKIVPTGEPTLSATTLTYGQALSAINLSGKLHDNVNNKDVEGMFTWADGTVKPNAGSYEAAWKFTPADGGTYTEADGTVTITVNKAKPTGDPIYTRITAANKTLKDAALKPNTSWPTGTIQWVDKDGKELPDTTEVKANTAYKWVFTPSAENAANYTTATGELTLYSVSTGGGGGGSSSGSTVKTDTVTNPDGSVTKIETKSDGTVVATTTGKDGGVSKTETKKDGSSVTENKAADGSTGTVKTDKNGQTEAKTALSNKAIENAKKNGEAVKAPVEVEAARNSGAAPTVKVELPKNAGETEVEIPVSNAKPGTVAVLVHPDGTEEILKDSIPTENGIRLTVDGSATVKIVDNSKDFIDTQNHWAKDEIDFVSARELVNGISATRYAPNATATRAQLWTILARQNDTDLSGGANWYEKAQLWSKDKGISDGTQPDAAINRAQMVTMLWRTMGQPAAGGAANFNDVPANSYYAQAVAWAVENGITTGIGGGRFDPNSTCTRAQIATFLWRAMAE